MNANIKGTLFVKADRINERVEKVAQCVFHEKQTISKKEFDDFIKSIHLIVDTELNERGVERKWKA